MSKSPLQLSDEHLAVLIEEGEGTRAEFKREFGSSDGGSQIRKSICAFANDLGGSGKSGAVFIGIDDDGTPAGIDVDDQLLLSLLDMRCDGNIVPPPTLLAEKRVYQGKDIAVVTVIPSNSPPVRYKGAIYVRRGPRPEVASAQEEIILSERCRHGNRPFDLSPVPGTGIDDIDQTRFNSEYLPRAVDRETLAVNDRSLAQRLVATKMIEPDSGEAT
ncbi:MAG: ATP-binding protein, partial [Betaproteobacteria bacterium]|nr:ATP-binding protein [Betaproteobacteria bacterium]